jgi:hypothetical protein
MIFLVKPFAQYGKKENVFVKTAPDFSFTPTKTTKFILPYFFITQNDALP